jgi:hypothetical protein
MAPKKVQKVQKAQNAGQGKRSTRVRSKQVATAAAGSQGQADTENEEEEPSQMRVAPIEVELDRELAELRTEMSAMKGQSHNTQTPLKRVHVCALGSCFGGGTGAKASTAEAGGRCRWPQQ